MERENPFPSEDVSLFIGCLPGEDTRRMVLFPEGRVVAEIRSEEIRVDGYEGPDRGAGASGALIKMLLAHGWFIDQIDRPTSIWLRPNPQSANRAQLRIGGVDASLGPEG